MKYASIPFNPGPPGWSLNEIDRRRHPRLQEDIQADWVIIGSGFAGVAFARRLANLDSRLKIVLIDAESAIESSAARNSGFIIGLPHNIGSSTAELKKAQDYRTLLQRGIQLLEEEVNTHQIECEWENAGKYHCQIDPASEAILQEYIDNLESMQEPYQLLDREALYEKLGTRLYSKGIYTPGCIQVNPAKLIAGLARSLPESVTVYDDTPALFIRNESGPHVVTPQGTIRARNVMLATNALSPELSPKQARQASMATYASITEPLTPEQRSRLPEMKSWGTTPVNAIAGATLRYTQDHRFLVRQCVDPALNGRITPAQSWKAAQQHLATFRKAYPQLNDVKLAHTWSGTISVTRNGAPVWGQLAPCVWTAGGCNGAGISKQTVAGNLLADYALGRENPLIAAMKALGQANYIPPSPLLDVFVIGTLWKERYFARKEA
ncbi:NAD(P)/FAD-dependent oxidoreductase [Enterobacillus tribolii]|uniref:Glycine/D-amino acid oxidase-like deaminating enzyme n=1 Tax=Enterobacillus tribolii TaxID=1487935 RepID=A0A370QNP1_9GAMM|nr:FAD-binding oxidoreductase [Enterobacillus tribolii]MBW7981997.1 FAD-binding oxidoreductase [Enterobacillus tribolii]RDK89984.1 glycine/D-amino acid oxidase-like deaminating enzyme [Enterobacillus tribolii]